MIIAIKLTSKENEIRKKELNLQYLIVNNDSRKVPRQNIGTEYPKVKSNNPNDNNNLFCFESMLTVLNTLSSMMLKQKL